MTRVRTIALAAITACALQGLTSVRAQGVVEDFSADPTSPHGASPGFMLRGPVPGPFAYDADTAPRFDGDRKGSLAVTYDSLAPTARLFAPVPGGFTQDDDFVFGAVLTIRAEGLSADPGGFHPVAFGLFNAATTGDDRTGDPGDFRADAWDTVELSYFPNVSPLFGGPFLSADAFGGRVSDDAFDRFAFGSVELELTPGVTYLVELRHVAAARTLTCRAWAIAAGGPVAVAGATVVVDLSGIGGFLVDSLGIASYHDGFNVFSSSGRSLMATVDYDLLYGGPLVSGRPTGPVAGALRRLGRGGGPTARASGGR